MKKKVMSILNRSKGQLVYYFAKAGKSKINKFDRRAIL